MSTRRGNRGKRCPACYVHQDNCFCNQISSIRLQTKVSILLFKKERFLPSNTAHLTIKSLQNSECFERGHKDKELQPDFIDRENYQPLILFPSEESQILTKDFVSQFAKPINLIVPDGTWRQAKKVPRRESLLADIPHVKLNLKIKSSYQLRRQKFEYGLCTHEAIAYSLGIIEGLSAQETLLKNFKIFHDSHLINRDIFEKE